MNSSKSNEINTRHKKIFNELYGWDKARQEGIEYCKLLTKGLDKEEIRKNHLWKNQSLAGVELITQGKLTAEQSADIDLVIVILNIKIQLAAEKAYCPEHKDS
ncbi:hypothetical protein H6F47_06105 [Sphaerospermopsis sp. FACHB-1094]|nr:hypothetical protein [Sphaerospermopsis sp. FACHB-1094]